MLGFMLRTIGRAQIILTILALAALPGQQSLRGYSDRMQIALPMIASGCAAMNRSGSEYFARFVGLMVVVHGTKAALGDAEMNQRPSGSDKGFPSGHTAAAAYGASALVSDCVRGNALIAVPVVLVAAFVGGSRIELGKHDVGQVIAGGVFGWAADRALRRGRPLRDRIGARLLLWRQRMSLALSRAWRQLRVVRRRARLRALTVWRQSPDPRPQALADPAANRGWRGGSRGSPAPRRGRSGRCRAGRTDG